MNKKDIVWGVVTPKADPAYANFVSNTIPLEHTDTSWGVKLQACDILLFLGGKDIPPSFYNETQIHPSTQTKTPSPRDLFEAAVYIKAKKLNLPMVGICRGAQLLWALEGGKLIQHITNHNKSHWISCYLQDKIYYVKISSDHHQLMDINFSPSNTQLLGWSNALGTQYTPTIETLSNTLELEIALIPKSKILCIQGHPEWMDQQADFPKLCKHYINKYLLT